MILLLLLAYCRAASSSSIDFQSFLGETLTQLENETLALVNVNDEVSNQMADYVNYRVNYEKGMINVDSDMIRECSMIVINASCVTSVR